MLPEKFISTSRMVCRSADYELVKMPYGLSVREGVVFGHKRLRHQKKTRDAEISSIKVAGQRKLRLCDRLAVGKRGTKSMPRTKFHGHGTTPGWQNRTVLEQLEQLLRHNVVDVENDWPIYLQATTFAQRNPAERIPGAAYGLDSTVSQHDTSHLA